MFKYFIMRIETIIIIITIFLVYNTYYDGKYTAYLMNGKKYYKMLNLIINLINQIEI